MSRRALIVAQPRDPASSPFAVGEPAAIDVTGSYTNDTGANLVLELRGVITKTGGGVPTISQPNSFLEAS